MDRALTYVEATFSMSSGILNSLDEAVVLLARTQNVTKTRRFCVVRINTNAVLSVNLLPKLQANCEMRTGNFFVIARLSLLVRVEFFRRARFLIWILIGFGFVSFVRLARFVGFSRSHFKKLIY